MRFLLAALPILLVAACEKETRELALLGPYREPADQCRWVDPTPDTVSLMQEGTDVVACPAGYDGIAIFISDVNATEIARMGDWILFRVPQPWRG